MMKSVISFIFFFIVTLGMNAQELNCNVQINSDKVSGSNKSVFNSLQKAIIEFMNNRRWTEMTFTNSERIDCTLSILINKMDGSKFSAELQIQSRRPVYGSSYYSPILNLKDQSFDFEYNEFDQLEITENVVSSNLTGVLSYYAYLIIGYDSDSFSRLGGTPYFQTAESIVNAFQSTDYSGWKASFKDSRNRYAIINNIMDEAFKKYRNYYYEYHRLGLDEMYLNPTNGRTKILIGLPILREANRARPSSVIIGNFMDAKSDELINIFSKATEKEKSDAVKILCDINPTNTDKFEKILNK